MVVSGEVFVDTSRDKCNFLSTLVCGADEEEVFEGVVFKTVKLFYVLVLLLGDMDEILLYHLDFLLLAFSVGVGNFLLLLFLFFSLFLFDFLFFLTFFFLNA